MNTRAKNKLLKELRVVQDRIDAAYWTFTRTARGKPPVLVVPDAYRRRGEIQRELRALGNARKVKPVAAKKLRDSIGAA